MYGKTYNIPTGYKSLDEITFGLRQQELTVISGDPGVGKTSLMLNIARNIAIDSNIGVLFLSPDMNADILIKRFLLTETFLFSEKIFGKEKLTDVDRELLEYKCQKFAKAPIYFDDTPRIRTEYINDLIARMKDEHDIQIVFLDNLHLVIPPKNYDTREQEISAIVRELHYITRESNVAFITSAILNRKWSSDGKAELYRKPILTDLRDSGAIENIADTIIFIHRPEYVGLSEDIIDHEKAELIIAKSRVQKSFNFNKSVDMVFDETRLLFMELETAMERLFGKHESDKMSISE